MHLQILPTSLWVCISALLLVAHAIPVTPNAKLSSTDVEQFHLASEVLEKVQYFTNAYRDIINKTSNTTDLAFRSFYNQTVVALSNERAQELKIAVGLMTGGLLHGATTVNETIAMLQNHRSLESFRPNPEQLQMVSGLIEKVHKYQKSRSGLHVAVVRISPRLREYHGTIIFNKREFTPICDYFLCSPRSSCRRCRVRPGKHISITTSNSIPDIVIVNNKFYEPVWTSKKTNSTNGVTQRDLNDQTGTKVTHSKTIPPEGPDWARFTLGLPIHIGVSHFVNSASLCSKRFKERWLWRVSPFLRGICSLEDNDVKAPPLQSRGDHDHHGMGHPGFPQPPCRSGILIYLDTTKSLVCVPTPSGEKVEAYSYANCNETFWGCWGSRRD
ncbi:hypothetical protein N7G274_005198 [Stereocaulon virgatum]|uniref:Uncharacterized protein n=1 Tax=Stereocaulon virgatum TaxID=373712 RepID=A0ABR4A961_9LECA